MSSVRVVGRVPPTRASGYLVFYGAMIALMCSMIWLVAVAATVRRVNT